MAEKDIISEEEQIWNLWQDRRDARKAAEAEKAAAEKPAEPEPDKAKPKRTERPSVIKLLLGG